MYQSLRKLSFKAVMPRFVTALVCAVILVGLCVPALLDLAVGAKDFSAESSAGDYVSFEKRYVVGAFAQESAGDKLRNTYYILDLGSGRFAALKVKAEDVSDLSDALTQSESFYHSKTIDELKPMGTAKGTVSAMDSQTRGFLEQGLGKAELEGEIVPITINMGKISFLSPAALAWLGGFGLAFLIWAAIELALVFSGFYQKTARAAAESICSNEETEADFDAAIVFDHVRVGEKLMWYQLGAKSHCTSVPELLWGFERLDSRVLGSHRYSLELYTRSGECVDIRTRTETERQPIAAAITSRGNPFIYGYSQDRAALFARDRNAFLRMAKSESLGL